MATTYMDLPLHINFKLPIGPRLAESTFSKSMSGRRVLLKIIHFHWLISSEIEYNRDALDAVEMRDTTAFSVTPCHLKITLSSYTTKMVARAASSDADAIMPKVSGNHANAMLATRSFSGRKVERRKLRIRMLDGLETARGEIYPANIRPFSKCSPHKLRRGASLHDPWAGG